jgi:hypothetical protein
MRVCGRYSGQRGGRCRGQCSGHEDGFAIELAEARRALAARPCEPWSPDDDNGRGSAVASAGGVDAARSASREPHQKTTNRNFSKTRARTAAADFLGSGWKEMQRGTSVFSDGLFPRVSVPAGGGDTPFEAAVDFCLRRIGPRLHPHASVSAIVQALKLHGICACGADAVCAGEACEQSGVEHVRQTLRQKVRSCIQAVASSVLREDAQGAGWTGEWDAAAPERAKKRTKDTLGLVCTPAFMASPVRAAVTECAELPAMHLLRQAPPPLRDALSSGGTGFVRVPLADSAYELPTVETAPRTSRKDRPNFSKGQREIVAGERMKLGDGKRARYGSVNGNDFVAGLCGKVGEGPVRALQLWMRTGGAPRASTPTSA